MCVAAPLHPGYWEYGCKLLDWLQAAVSARVRREADRKLARLHSEQVRVAGQLHALALSPPSPQRQLMPAGGRPAVAAAPTSSGSLATSGASSRPSEHSEPLAREARCEPYR